jgi:hypothetical protein
MIVTLMCWCVAVLMIVMLMCCCVGLLVLMTVLICWCWWLCVMCWCRWLCWCVDDCVDVEGWWVWWCVDVLVAYLGKKCFWIRTMGGGGGSFMHSRNQFHAELCSERNTLCCACEPLLFGPLLEERRQRRTFFAKDHLAFDDSTVTEKVSTHKIREPKFQDPSIAQGARGVLNVLPVCKNSCKKKVRLSGSVQALV